MSNINNAPTICFVYSKASWRKIGTKTGSTFKTGAVLVEAVSWPQPGPGSEENLKICKEIKYFMLLFLF